ncbi:TPA: hypothetical protein ACMUBB_002782 [Enterococcus faecalis]|uniref:hypothetical protein n=1 Tax=Bacillota TaxID=1239 RepID=UPI0006617D1E|nr:MULTISPECIES: hypothetical protein [Bacillota]HAP4961841.1 hypothetical protein [Enterococcus faecalis ADL-336]HEM8842784.1 hypothetical protein [Proteus mirabilis]EKC6627400.1 hypothetical protein [Enterococcus faecalis]MDF4232134.1 hypothetical protein [Enterococcus faecalis]MDU3729623.1 hypothetical protein [Enterococcus faecalis]
MNDVTKLTKAVKKLFDKIANLVTKEELQDYAKKTDIPNTDNFVTKTQLESDLTKYAKKPEDVSITDTELNQWLEEFIQ